MIVYDSKDYETFHQTFWLPDNTHFIQTAHRQIQLWNAKTGRRERIFTTPLQPSLQAETTNELLLRAISPGGKYLAATEQDNKEKVSKIFVFEIGSGKLLRTIVATTVHDVGFSSNGALLAIGITWPRSHTEIWNWRIDEKPRTIIPDIAVYDSLDGAWSPDNSRIAIGTENCITIYETTTGELLATMATQTANDAKEFAANPPDWLIWTPQGYFNAPDHGRKRVRWEEDGKLIPLDSPRDKVLRAKFYNPKTVAQAIESGD
jgi:WD40 repeat protein